VSVKYQNLAKLRDGKHSRFRNQTIGFVFQFFYLQPFLSLQTNVEVPAMFARTRRHDRHVRSAELAANVDLSDRLKHLPRELSGGQMQRAAIARALQNKPDVLLADEPTGNLDRSNALAIFDLFKKIRDEHGTTIVVVTHDLELASHADRVISMSDGRINA
jgi:ABC-type lipoprotein export system ATPase subunit